MKIQYKNIQHARLIRSNTLSKNKKYIKKTLVLP